MGKDGQGSSTSGGGGARLGNLPAGKARALESRVLETLEGQLRALVTGIAGFVGSHLAELLLVDTGLQVGGIAQRTTDHRNIVHLLPRLTLFNGDIRDYHFFSDVLASWRPDYVFHLAAQAAPSLSWNRAQETLAVNILGQYNVLLAVAENCPQAAVLVVGSAEEYGLVDASELPVKETNPLRPINPYAVSKIAQDMLGYQFFRSHELRAIRVRPFNHIGPRQSEAFVAASFASQIARIEVTGEAAPVLRTGNLDAKRDFCDVRDVVRAYKLALDLGVPGEVYNIGSGRAWSMESILGMLLKQSPASVAVEQDPDRMRPSDIPELVCDASKFKAQTGWSPAIGLEQSLSDVLKYWRMRWRQG